ncbi:SOS response-associated peptidase [Citricoccus alkalitolerans]|uniref:Abasic site processing protein n=1 Tax=Citricoccus alkalitolerans TaxID=246603 RepID=A0ABV8XXG6_9MICC
MCGRYVMARAIGDLVADSGADVDEELVLPPNWNVAPTDDVAVVLERAVPTSGSEAGTRREIHVARWGLVPPWAKDLSVGSRAFNARSESVTEKPTFRSAVKARRCAVPVDGYYEWLKPDMGAPKSAKKRPFYVHSADGSPTYFAGLYEWWRDESMPEGDPGRWLLSCTILTGPSPDAADLESARRGGVNQAGLGILEQLGGLHDRLPLPLDRDSLDAWLDPVKLPSAEAAEALVAQVREQAYRTASAWTLDEVGTAVGNVRNNGPELIEPLESLL